MSGGPEYCAKMREQEERSKRKKSSNSYTEKSGKFKRGNPGRPKGTKDKFTDLKQAYLDVFEKIEIEGQKKGGKIKALFEWATKNDRNQGMFYQMIAKMLPSNVDIEHSGEIKHKLSITELKKSLKQYKENGS